jgi:thioredoxin-like negative regulator of GroEL
MAAVSLALTSDIDGAARMLEHALAMNPRHPLVLYYRGMLLMARGSAEEALVSLEMAQPGAMFPGIVAARINALRMLGRTGEAAAALATLRRGPRDMRTNFELGLASAYIGELDLAFDHFGQVSWDVPTVIVLRTDPLLEPLRVHRRYPSLLRALGLPVG